MATAKLGQCVTRANDVKTTGARLGPTSRRSASAWTQALVAVSRTPPARTKAISPGSPTLEMKLGARIGELPGKCSPPSIPRRSGTREGEAPRPRTQSQSATPSHRHEPRGRTRELGRGGPSPRPPTQQSTATPTAHGRVFEPLEPSPHSGRPPPGGHPIGQALVQTPKL
jgi:hypothetical protein